MSAAAVLGKKPTVPGCPLCYGRPVPLVQKGARSGKFFLNGCEHAWKVVNYQAIATTAEEAAERWAAWTVAVAIEVKK